MSNAEFIKSLGWEELFFWNNRQLYTIGNKRYCLFIHLHDDSVGTAMFKRNGDFTLHYGNLTHTMIKKYTDKAVRSP